MLKRKIDHDAVRDCVTKKKNMCKKIIDLRVLVHIFLVKKKKWSQNKCFIRVLPMFFGK